MSTDFSCLSNPGITFQEATNFVGSVLSSQDSKNEFLRFLKSTASSQISFKANAHLGFLFSCSIDEDFANYFSNTVFSEILLANYISFQSMPQIPEDWGNIDSSEYATNYRMCLSIRQAYQIPLIENFNQVQFLEVARIDDGVVKVQIDFQTVIIQASAIIKATCNKPIAKEIIMYMQKGYPRFYGVLSNIIIQNQPCSLAFFDQHTETFKQNMTIFNNLKKTVKDSMKDERQALALNLYRQLILELNNYRNYELFHNNVCPSSILIYNNSETSGEYKAFLFNGGCMQFRLVDGATDAVLANLNYENKNKRYTAPEKTNAEAYCKKYSINYNEFSYNVSDAWALAACILNFVTDLNADKWNLLNFAGSLKNIINSLSNQKLKDILSSSLVHDLRSRLKFNEALERFD